jgi:large subunit ribosomal protein L15
MTKLNELAPQEGSTQARKRVGRGIGSGTGKTAGRGYKGQKARSGVSIAGFEGGQMPIYMRMPKRGFTSRNRKDYVEVNLSTLQTAIDAKKLDTKGVVTAEDLAKAGVISKAKDGVRLLGRGELKSKIALKINGATAAAKEAVEKAGGSIELIVHTSAKQEADKAKRAAKLEKLAAATAKK